MTLVRAILFVKDLERMLAFYRDGLGLKPKAPASGGWVELDSGGATLALHAIPAAIAAGITVTSPPKPREETPLKLAFATSDVAAARERLSGLGAVMHEVKSWGACDGVDPEGNVFQLTKA